MLGTLVGTKDNRAGQDGEVDVMPGKHNGAPGMMAPHPSPIWHSSAASLRAVLAEPPRSQPGSALSAF